MFVGSHAQCAAQLSRKDMQRLSRLSFRPFCCTSEASGTDGSHYVINFYHLSDVAKPGETAKHHKIYIREQGWDICGRIYISYQGINAQFSGPKEDALAYTNWVAAQPEFRDLTWRAYSVSKHTFPKLRLKYRPNLISLKGGMLDLPVTGTNFYSLC
jgi:predicted sulfurtransferase